MYDWFAHLIASMRGDMQYEVITLGYDGNERRIGPRYDSLIVAKIIADAYAAEYAPVPFTVRPVA